MNIDKSKAVCFSGHRPEKLFGISETLTYYDEPVKRVMSIVYMEIDSAIKQGYDTFIIGMARGVDLWIGSLLLELKRIHPDIKIVCAIPFRDQASSLEGEEKLTYMAVLSMAAEVVYVSEAYTRDCMLRRNRFMVDNSSKLIAVVRDWKSGTGQTIRYAQKKGIDVRIIDIEGSLPMFFA